MPPRKTQEPQPRAKTAPKFPDSSRWIIYGVLCGIVLIAYINSFGLGFALDGRYRALTDSRVHAATAENLRLILTKHYWWPEASDRLYRPLTLLTFLFNYAVLGNGANATGYHVLNLLLHMLNVCLLFELVLAAFGRRETALLAALLWAVHPVQTEAVANLAGRADLLGGAAVLGGLLIYIRLTNGEAGRRYWWPAGLFAVALAGVFSKENAAVLIGLMLLWDLAFGWQRKPGWQPRQAAYLVMAATLCILAAVRWKIFSGEPLPLPPVLDNPIYSAGFLAGRLTALGVIGRYLGLLVWPAHLSSDYSYNQIPVANLSDAGPWLALLVIGAIVGTVIARYRADRAMFFAAGFFGVTLLPTANLLFPIGSIMALRFLYLPSAGFAVAAVVLAERLGRPKAVRALLGVAIVLLAARTLARNPAWQDNVALGLADVETAPASFRTHQLLAQALYEADQKGNLDHALREYELSWKIVERVPPAINCPKCANELGMMYYAKANAAGGEATPDGRAWFGKSAAMLEQALIVTRGQAKAFEDEQISHGLPARQVKADANPDLYLARAYAHLGRPDDALRTYREAQRLNPSERAVYDEMATLYASQAKLEQAAVLQAEKAFVLGLNEATATSLRNLYARIPGGECALKIQGGTAELNLDCPRVRADMCAGWAELDTAYRAGGQIPRADSIRVMAIQRYGCPAAAFPAGQ